ncbi:MAG: hypothetical protein WBH20_09350 [Oceanisphaera sp.]|uniref:hypothetical protein n=1 Tax=Oceanisphaera sp. TaxID=1929979 RepID=UPI003C74F74B
MEEEKKKRINPKRINLSAVSVVRLERLIEYFGVETTGALANKTTSLIRALYESHRAELEGELLIAKLEKLVNKEKP